jgi:Na+/H+ antiporter NhaD/arsenite permease-like protein
MDAIGFLAAGVFVFGYVFITLEQRLGTHKSAIALMMGGILWILAAIKLRDDEHDALKHALSHAGSEIFGIVAFLLGAMALVEILIHYRFFDLLRAKLISLKMGDRQQFLLMMAITFSLSGVLDNIAITIAMLQIAKRFFTGKNLLVAAAGIVIMANAGGAWSPIGDVTTILLWLGGKFGALDVITATLLPAIAIGVVATSLLYRKLNDTDFMEREQGDMVRLSRGEKLVIGSAMGSFLLPLVMNIIGLPPYMGLLLGLGITWGVIELEKHRRLDNQTHLTADIERLMQSVDLATIKFVMGILLSVSALALIGVLSFISAIAVGDNPDATRVILINIGLGLFSSIVDNTSLVAVAMNIIPIADPQLWTLTALAAGTGGSIFIIASAAGMVAMGSVKQLTFQSYIKIGTVPALAGFAAGIGAWLLQQAIV